MKGAARSHHKRIDGAVIFEDGVMANTKEGRDQLSVAIVPNCELRSSVQPRLSTER
jgi:hypothetical protein